MLSRLNSLNGAATAMLTMTEPAMIPNIIGKKKSGECTWESSATKSKMKPKPERSSNGSWTPKRLSPEMRPIMEPPKSTTEQLLDFWAETIELQAEVARQERNFEIFLPEERLPETEYPSFSQQLPRPR